MLSALLSLNAWLMRHLLGNQDSGVIAMQ